MRIPIASAPVRRRGSRRDRSVAWNQSSGVMMSQEVPELAADNGELLEDAGIDLEEGTELPLDLGDEETFAGVAEAAV